MALVIHLNSKKLDGLVEKQLEKIKEVFREMLIEAFETAILPALKEITPFRSGDLRDSIKLIVKGNTFSVFVDQPGHDYYPFQLRGELPAMHRKLFNEMVEKIVPILFKRAIKKVLGQS